MILVSVTAFGLAGVFSRYYCGELATRHLPASFPFGTFLVNILGALMIGTLYALGLKHEFLSPALRAGLLVGFLGGFTTFSSYCLDAIKLIEEKQYRRAAFYFILSPLFGLLAAFIGVGIPLVLL